MYTRAPTPSTITTQCVYRSCHVPDLKLEQDLSLPFRVYVLMCKGKHANDEYYWYVGIIETKYVVVRIKKHFGPEEASSYTQAHRPLSIAFVWPAATAATEALVIHLPLALSECCCQE